MSNYRPKDWDNPHLWVDEDGFDKWGEHYDSYEAGADAMLGELLTKGLKVNNINFKEHPGKGTVIFIPEEE